MKSNKHKIKLIYEQALDNKIDILDLAEMNISRKEGFFMTKYLSEYREFWSKASSSKKKGSGVKILVDKR